MHERDLQDYLNPAEKKWAEYFVSILEKVANEHVELCTPFADPRQQQIAGDIAEGYSELKCLFWGGIPEAERARIFVSPFPEVKMTQSSQVGCLVVKGKFPAHTLTHRDFLGAVLGLGLRREMVGDIIYRGGDTAFIIIHADLVPFLLQGLQEVGRYAVEVSTLDLEELEQVLPPKRVKEIKGTVPSMRIDVVAGLGFGLSRSKIAPLIKGGQVKVNHQVINQPSRLVKLGDMISLAGKGRIELVSSSGETRKGRLHLLIHRII